VTLSPSLFDLVTRMGGLQRASRSQVLRELLEAAEPALQRAVALMEAAERAKGAVNREFGESLERSQQRIESVLEEHLAKAEGATADLVRLAERIEGRRPGRRAERGGVGGAPSDPPASNRGVKSGTTPIRQGHPKARATAVKGRRS
jgi:hypothetical protein